MRYEKLGPQKAVRVAAELLDEREKGKTCVTKQINCCWKVSLESQRAPLVAAVLLFYGRTEGKPFDLLQAMAVYPTVDCLSEQLTSYINQEVNRWIFQGLVGDDFEVVYSK